VAISEVHEALGSFDIKLKRNIPREVLDALEYFGHIAVIPGRADARVYGDGTLDAARYVGVVRKKRIGDDGQADEEQVPVTLSGVGMNFWLGDEEDKGFVLEDEIQLTSVNFSTAISAVMPPSVQAGTIGGVSGTYSGVHQWQTPRKAIQYICDTMTQPATAPNLLSDDNHSFEGSGGAGGYTGSNATATVTGAYAFLGTKSMWVIPSSTGAISVRTKDAANSANVTAGTKYNLSYWILPTATGCSARIGVNYKNAGYTTTSSATAMDYVTLPANAWTQISRSVTVPTGQSITDLELVVEMFCNSTANRFAVDAVEVRANTEPVPVSFRVNNDATLDAGPESDLFVTDPQCIIVRRDTSAGEDLRVRAIPASIDLDQDMEDFATRVVVLAGSDGFQFSVGKADIGSVAPEANVYKDMFGQPLRLTKLVSESETSDTNADARAELNLRNTLNPHREIRINSHDYDIYGSFEVGDYIYVYDPDTALYDTDNEIYFRGVRLNPIKLQVTEAEWPVTEDYSVAYRDSEGNWYDLTDYIDFEDRDETKVTIGDFQRVLDDDLQDVNTRLGTNLTPDGSTPGAPDWVTGSFETVTYLDNQGYAKATQKVVWNTPVNADDGSDITDGAYYEIQFKLSTGHQYSQTWGAVSTLDWDDLGTWGQPVEPTSASDWESRIVGWDFNSFNIQELAVGTAYDVRIRAIDASNNVGAWSEQETFTTATDNIPPTQPAAPEVASSLIAIQITHHLGMISGGTFNLENDLAHLEIHVHSSNAFEPDSTTLVGKLRANRGMMLAQTPAVGTFQVTSTDNVYVKVVAVDMSGNRSSPSPAAQSSAELIDDQHISSLTVSKVTAGEIQANWILSGSIKTGEEGQRVELNANGLQAYDANGDLTTNLSSDPSDSGQYISFTNGDGETLAAISSEGAGTFQSIDAKKIVLNGQDLEKDILNPMGKGVVAWGYADANVSTAGVEKGYMELAFEAEQNRMYKVEFICDLETSGDSAATDLKIHYNLVLRDGGGDVPTLSSPRVCSIAVPGDPFFTNNATAHLVDIRTYTPGIHRLLITFDCHDSLTCVMRGADGPALFWIEDMGDVGFFNNTGYINPGNGTTAAPSDGGGNLVKTYKATWSGTYAGSGATGFTPNSYLSDYLDRIAQGQYSTNRGNQKALVGLPYEQIQADLSGAVVKKMEFVMYMPHSYYDYGTDTVIGTHNYTTRPSTWSGANVQTDRTRYYGWPKGGTRAVLLPESMWSDIQDGTATGIAVGPGVTNDIYYYSYYNGADPDYTPSSRPYLKVTYSK
jgi:hypothetical protein